MKSLVTETNKYLYRERASGPLGLQSRKATKLNNKQYMHTRSTLWKNLDH